MKQILELLRRQLLLRITQCNLWVAVRLDHKSLKTKVQGSL